MTASVVRAETILVLDLIGNGSHKSAIDSAGRIWATERGSEAMLYAIACEAKQSGYESFSIGSQSWLCESVINSL